MDKELEKMLEQIDNMDGYTDVCSVEDNCNLDGWFTADELRLIANALDKIHSVKNSNLN